MEENLRRLQVAAYFAILNSHQGSYAQGLSHGLVTAYGIMKGIPFDEAALQVRSCRPSNMEVREISIVMLGL